jgi:hypothetical protein
MDELPDLINLFPSSQCGKVGRGEMEKVGTVNRVL